MKYVNRLQMVYCWFAALAGYLVASRINQSAIIGEILVGLGGAEFIEPQNSQPCGTKRKVGGTPTKVLKRRAYFQSSTFLEIYFRLF
ncbi:MAG: hypothetical protein R6U44_09220 [Archaeoglobaceae archaeon]